MPGPAFAINRPEYTRRAAAAAQFIIDNLYAGGRLPEAIRMERPGTTPIWKITRFSLPPSWTCMKQIMISDGWKSP
ncbi:MAG: hypothetical protein R2875_17180 [Desulfobacterales bacterium]